MQAIDQLPSFQEPSRRPRQCLLFGTNLVARGERGMEIDLTEGGAVGQTQAAMQSACIMEFKLQLASRTLKRELLKSAPGS